MIINQAATPYENEADVQAANTTSSRDQVRLREARKTQFLPVIL